MRNIYYIDIANLSWRSIEQFMVLYKSRKAIHDLTQIVYEWNFTAKPSQIITFTKEEL